MRGWLILALCFLAGFPAVAAAAEYSRDGWTGFIEAGEKTGEFLSCTVTRQDPNFASVDISLVEEKAAGAAKLYLFIAVSNLAWSLEANRTYSWKMWVDGQLLATDKVQSFKGYIVIVPMFYNAEILRILSRGDRLKISVAENPVSFPLRGSARAIEWLEACATRAAPGARRTPD